MTGRLSALSPVAHQEEVSQDFQRSLHISVPQQQFRKEGYKRIFSGYFDMIAIKIFK